MFYSIVSRLVRVSAVVAATTGVATGGAIGGTLGLLAGIGALAGLGVGGAVGRLVGALGMGIPEYEAKRYEGHLKEGGVRLSVHGDTGGQITRRRIS